MQGEKLMSESEVLAIGFGLFIGYWVISRLILSNEPNNDNNDKRNTNEQENYQSKSEEPGWHEVLKVSQFASLEEIHLAYKSLIRQYHPDKVASLGDELKFLAEEKSKTINAAYQSAIKERGG
jgi:DnaJ like chaperone protein